jgi:hypothetical protein
MESERWTMNSMARTGPEACWLSCKGDAWRKRKQQRKEEKLRGRNRERERGRREGKKSIPPPLRNHRRWRKALTRR